jgi:tetratricopeptide (TPR) repeat protein
LLGARPERHLWTETYQRSLRDVLALHSEIASTVARQIAATIGDTAKPISEGTRSALRPQAVNPEAYDEYLRGRYYLAQAPPTLTFAIRHFERAIQLDSTSAQAHAGLAVSYWLFRNIQPEYLSRARVEARVATDLDPTLSDAHVAVALTRMADWDWEGSEAAFRKAIGLNPSLSLARQWYAQLLRMTLRLDDAMREARKAIELDPFSLFLRTMEGWVLFNQRRQDEALEVYRKVLELEPGYGLAIYNQGLSYWVLRRGDKVIDAASRSMQARLRMTEPHATYLLSVGYALAGRPNEARAILDSLDARYGAAFPYTMRAALYHALGDDAMALTLLERALVLREPELPNVTSEPQLDGLRQHPRFRALRAQMRLP